MLKTGQITNSCSQGMPIIF